jgi:hypothetical protein
MNVLSSAARTEMNFPTDPVELRAMIRAGRYAGQTSAHHPGAMLITDLLNSQLSIL